MRTVDRARNWCAPGAVLSIATDPAAEIVVTQLPPARTAPMSVHVSTVNAAQGDSPINSYTAPAYGTPCG